ncbi:MAG: hypothetical protein FWC46_05155 [Actinomycetia bacterium]|nr:hypothetical protein [Actinomycetes bacterium]
MATGVARRVGAGLAGVAVAAAIGLAGTAVSAQAWAADTTAADTRTTATIEPRFDTPVTLPAELDPGFQTPVALPAEIAPYLHLTAPLGDEGFLGIVPIDGGLAPADVPCETCQGAAVDEPAVAPRAEASPQGYGLAWVILGVGCLLVVSLATVLALRPPRGPAEPPKTPWKHLAWRGTRGDIEVGRLADRSRAAALHWRRVEAPLP